MESTAIQNHSELIRYIEDLKIQKKEQETEITDSAKQILRTINILSFFKKSKQKSNQPIEIVRDGITMVMDMIIESIYGKKSNYKVFIGTLIEKTINYLIANNFDTIISYITRLLRKTTENSSENFDEEDMTVESEIDAEIIPEEADEE